MKRIILSIVAIASVLSVSAQFKPQAGAISSEVNLQLFNNSEENISTNGVNLRYFFNEGLAARLSVDFGLAGTSSVVEDIASKTNSKGNSSSSKFGINLGIEKHFNVAPRLSPYIGAELGVITYGYSAKSEVLNNASTPATSTTITYRGINSTNEIIARGGFGVGVFTGFDFYVYKGLYAGVEYGIRYETTWTGGWQIETKTNTGTTTVKSDDNGKKSSGSSRIAIEAAPSFKLGWMF